MPSAGFLVDLRIAPVRGVKTISMSRRLETALLMLPGLLWLTLFLVIPCTLVLAYAFMTRGVYGGVVSEFSLENITRVFDAVYIKIFLVSARIAILATLFSLLIGYPAAYAMSRARTSWQLPLLFLAILPFWSNYLIRTYAWIVLLNRAGLINHGLISSGLISEPLELLYNEFAIVIGLVYNYLPFVILSVFASIQRLNPELLEASEDLGASAWTTFRRVTLPLTMPGVVAGAVFVFVLSIGNFVTPDVLGGGQITMLGNVIYDQYLGARDWPFGSALALTVLTVMLGLLVLQAALAQRLRRIESGGSDA